MHGAGGLPLGHARHVEHASGFSLGQIQGTLMFLVHVQRG